MTPPDRSSRSTDPDTPTLDSLDPETREAAILEATRLTIARLAAADERRARHDEAEARFADPEPVAHGDATRADADTDGAHGTDLALDPRHAPADPFAAYGSPRDIGDAQKRAFLRAFAMCGNKTRAAEVAGVARTTPYRWEDDEGFAELLVLAQRMGAEALEAEAIRRATEGVLEPAGWYKGEAGGYVRKYSDTLLIFLMKGQMPEKYGDKVAVRGVLANLDYGSLTDDQLDRLARGENAMSVLQAGLQLPPGRDVTPDPGAETGEEGA